MKLSTLFAVLGVLCKAAAVVYQRHPQPLPGLAWSLESAVT